LRVMNAVPNPAILAAVRDDPVNAATKIAAAHDEAELSNDTGLPLSWRGRTAFYMSSGRTEGDHRRGDAICGEVETTVRDLQLGLTVDPWYDEQAPGAISVNVVRNILMAPFVFADLTGNNANVYYEVGVAHGAEVPVICFQTEGELTAFDLAYQRNIPVRFDEKGLIDRAKVRTAVTNAIQCLGRPSEVPETAVGVVRLAKRFREARDEIAELQQELKGKEGATGAQPTSTSLQDEFELYQIILELARKGRLDLADRQTLEAGQYVVDMHEGIGKILETRNGQLMTIHIRFRSGVDRTLEFTQRTKLYLLP